MSFIETERLRPATYASLARRRSRERLFDRLALAILVALVCVIAFTFRDYSISTDEEVQNTYGRLLLDFYLSGLTDTRAFGYSNLYLYGGLFDLIAAAIAPFSPLPDFEARHLLCATFGVLGIVATWRLARLLAGPRAGLLAVVLLVLCPAYYGAMFNNTKDIPFAAGMTWTLYLSCRLVACLPRPPFRLVAWLGVAAGASLGIRVGAVLAGLLSDSGVGAACLRRGQGRRLAGIGPQRDGHVAETGPGNSDRGRADGRVVAVVGHGPRQHAARRP